MKHQFEKHYTRDEANALLPQLRQWLEQLNRLREDLHRYEKRLSGLMEQGKDIGGETVNNWIRALADMQQILSEFQRREIFIKDLERGLLDFPAAHRRQGSFPLLGIGRGGRGILARPRNRLRRARAAVILAASLATAAFAIYLARPYGKSCHHRIGLRGLDGGALHGARATRARSCSPAYSPAACSPPPASSKISPAFPKAWTAMNS